MDAAGPTYSRRSNERTEELQTVWLQEPGEDTITAPICAYANGDRASITDEDLTYACPSGHFLHHLDPDNNRIRCCRRNDTPGWEHEATCVNEVQLPNRDRIGCHVLQQRAVAGMTFAGMSNIATQVKCCRAARIASLRGVPVPRTGNVSNLVFGIQQLWRATACRHELFDSSESTHPGTGNLEDE